MDYYNCPPLGFPSTSQNPYFSSNIPITTIPPNQFDPRLASKTFINTNTNPTSFNKQSDDELWVEAWLSKLGKITINLDNTITVNPSTAIVHAKAKTSKLSLHLAHRILVRCKNVIEELKTAEKYLRTNVATITSEEWKERTVKIGCLKEELTALFTQFEGPNILNSLKTAAFHRRKKRLSQKRRIERKKQALKDNLVECNFKHQEIDQWLTSMKDCIEKTKLEEIQKKDADCILSEVTKKKNDAKKYLALVKSLVELRTLREIEFLKNGRELNVEDKVAFTNVTDRLNSIWENALQNYTKEELTLKATLEKSAKDFEVNEDLIKDQKIISEWEEIFFGPKDVFAPALNPFIQADTDLEKFVAIRRSWDTFLTPPNAKGGTKIPVGWVLPNENASDDWINYLAA